MVPKAETPRKTTPPPNQTRFGALLRGYRERAGFTLREMESRGPFTYSHLCRIERGARNPPDREDVIRLASALDVDADELLVAAGYLPVSAPPPPAMAMLGTGPSAATDEERRLVDEANARRIYAGFVADPAFWRLPPEERRPTFRYLDGLIDEARRFERRKAEG
jgi:transcriptional regulator with XRE-family HTH domain